MLLKGQELRDKALSFVDSPWFAERMKSGHLDSIDSLLRSEDRGAADSMARYVLATGTRDYLSLFQTRMTSQFGGTVEERRAEDRYRRIMDEELRAAGEAARSASLCRCRSRL